VEHTKVKLGDILTSISETISREQQTAIFLNTSDISEGKFLHKKSSVVQELPGQAKKKIKNGDILFSEIRPKNKRYAVVNVSNPNDYVVSTKLMVLRIKAPSKYYLQYIYQKLISQKMLHQINEIAESRSGTFPQITFDAIKNIELNLPSLKEQKRIADILTALDDKIELNNQMNQTLEEIASLLYKRWFVDFEFPDDKGNPYKSSGGEMVDSELGMIPKGWEVKELGEVLEISSGNRPVQKSEEKTKENIFPIVGASKIMGYTNNYILDDTNEVLIIGRVGTLGIIQEYREKIWVSDNTLIIKSNFQNYIKQYLSNVDFYSLNSGSTQPLITQTTINKLLIVVPCNKVTDKFEKIESSNVRIKFCNTYEIKKIQRLKRELLKELI
jgi:type I restriction enzyme S subunit